MREARLPLPLIGLIAATRGLLGVGIGLLVSARVPKKHRMVLGTVLASAGVLSTIPLVFATIRRTSALRAEQHVREPRMEPAATMA